ncbi:MAG TPA: hypothetical protein PLX97_00415 [Gemmatales bacterium]|nr:hypothetical protein [Gemmatales bacterium]
MTRILLVGMLFPVMILAQDAKPKEKRLLGMSVKEAAGEQWLGAYTLARKAGVQVLGLSLAWDDLEPKPGQFNDQFVDVVAKFYPQLGIRVAFDIKTIDSNPIRMPADLKGKRWDDPVVIERFNKLCTHLLQKWEKVNLVCFAIGNEIDIKLGTDVQAWVEYERFFLNAVEHLKTQRPTLLVGTKITFQGLMGPSRQRARRLVNASDLNLTTYYPLIDDFTVKTNAAFQKDVEDLCRAYPRKPIQFLEIGCPSSPQCGSSEQHQAEFIQAMYAVWDRTGPQVQLMLYTWQSDISDKETADLGKYYGIHSPAFLGYLSTLGLRTNQGKNKPGWDAFVREAKARGW